MFIRTYLRASSADQDATRAMAELEAFAESYGHKVCKHYIENESGATLKRPKLIELIEDAADGDCLLCEQVDRCTRLNDEDWAYLKSKLAEKKIRLVALDLPTSHIALKGDALKGAEEKDFTGKVIDIINQMMLDVLAAVSRKDYEDRRRRQAQGIAKAVAENRYKGRQPDVERNAHIIKLMDEGKSWTFICKATGCSRSTLSRLNKQRLQQTSDAVTS